MFKKDPLKSDSASDRAAALQELETKTANELEKRLAALEREKSAAKEAAERRVSEARAMTEAKKAGLDLALAREMRSMVELITGTETVESFGKRPRAAAEELASAWRAFDARSRHELGTEPSEVHLTLAFAAAHGPDAEAVAGGDNLVEQTLATASRFARLAREGAHGAELEQVARDLERAVALQLRQSSYQANPARAAVRASCATRVSAGSALVAHDAEARAAFERRAAEENARLHEETGDRTRVVADAHGQQRAAERGPFQAG